MKRPSSRLFFVLTLLLVLLVSAMRTAPVYADDGTPPAGSEPAPSTGGDPGLAVGSDPAPVVDSGPADSISPVGAPTDSAVDVAAPVDMAPTDAAPVDTAPIDAAPTEIAPTTGDATTDSAVTTDPLAVVPDGTTVVVLDASGATVPLASAEAADIITNGDPMWCPAGVAPGGAGCTSPAGDFSTLKTAMAGKAPAAGVIWIQSTFATSVAITLDSSWTGSGSGAASVWANFALTLNGGWNGTPLSTSLDPLHPYTELNGNLDIFWNSDVTLNNITITGVSSGTALDVETPKNISLTNVHADNNPGGDGAHLWNLAGDGSNTGTISLVSSSFNGNHGNGVVAASDRTISVQNITANGNDFEGARLDNTDSLASQTVTLSGLNNFFNSNKGNGLVIFSNGAITLNNVTAQDNSQGSGAYLDNDFPGFVANVTLTGTNNFIDNGWDGLRVWTAGAIALNNVTANYNGTDPARTGPVDANDPTAFGKGAFLNNYDATVFKTVTLTGTNTFDNNSSTGLYVEAWGAVTLNNITADHNNTCDLDNAWVCDGAEINSGSSVTIIGYGEFSDNYDDGLQLLSYNNAPVVLNNITASDNGYWGTGVTTSGPLGTVKLQGTNVFSGNQYSGLNVDSEGVVTLINVSAYDNGLAGDPSDDAGIYVVSTAAITLTDVDAYQNDGNGAYLDNCNWDGGACVNNAPVTLTGTNFLSENGARGLEIHTLGAINASNLIANANGGRGAWLDNCGGVFTFSDSCVGSSTGAAVTLTGSNEFKFDGGGLAIFSNGAITLHNITATDGANGTGAWIDNSKSTKVGGVAVTLTGYGVFDSNAAAGLVVTSHGLITLNNISASDNGQGNFYQESLGVSGTIDPATTSGAGVFLENCGYDFADDSGCTLSGTGPGVTLSGTNDFSSNFYAGLYIYSRGAILVNNLGVYSSHADTGARLDNLAGGTAAAPAVTLTGYGTFQDNFYSGLGVHSYGIVMLTNLSADNNGGDNGVDSPVGWGVYLDNCNYSGGANTCAATTPKAVTISGNNEFSNNATGGLEIHSLGLVTLNNVEADDNVEFGAWIDNDHSLALAGVTITGFGRFYNNGFGYGSYPGFPYFPDGGGFGLNIASRGALQLAMIEASQNQNYGARLDNTHGTGGITLTGSGLDPANRFYSNGCDAWSADGNTCLSVHAGGLDYGLWATSNGAIAINNLRARWNGSYGALLDTRTGIGGVTLSGTWNGFTDNFGGDGLKILSKGAISAVNLDAENNVGNGAILDNCNFTGGTCTGSVPLVMAGITLTNTPDSSLTFSNNGNTGLRATSFGTISIMDVDAENNGQNNIWAADNDQPINSSSQGGYGLYLDNRLGAGNVSIGTTRANWGNSLSNNFLSGLELHTSGVVDLKSMRNDGNGGYDVADGIDSDPGTTGFDPLEDPGFGAFVDNTSGAGKAVSITGWNEFNDNYFSGLWVESTGAITVNNLTANHNYGSSPDTYGAWGAVFGANWYGHPIAPAAPLSLTLTGYGTFDNNYYSGLEVYTRGAITLTNIEATDNGWSGDGHGAYLDSGCGYDQGTGLCTLTGLTAQPVMLTGNNYYTRNETGGLEVHALGVITVFNLDTEDNHGFGALLDNHLAPLAGAGVNLNTWVDTDRNIDFGLWIKSRGAVLVTVGDMYTADNGSYGWYIDNSFGIGGVTMTSVNPDYAFDFSSNGDQGLHVDSTGAISITGLDSWSSQNGGDGAYLNNAHGGSAAGITITGGAGVQNNFGSNQGNGLTVLSNGAVSLANLHATWNGSDGVSVDNSTSVAVTPATFTLTGYGSFYNNGDNGLTVITRGAMTLASIEARDNGQNVNPSTGWGARLVSCPTTAGGCNDAGFAGPIMLTGTNSFNHNTQDGLYAKSLGLITINQLTANWNANDGANLNNMFAHAVGGITLTGTNSFQGNDGYGLEAHSHGAITTNNVSANWGNGTGGAWLETTKLPLALTAPILTMSGANNFLGNGGVGLIASAGGNITINSLTASSNDATGAQLASNLGTITLTGVNAFIKNNGDGLDFSSGGTTSISNIRADNNVVNGLYGSAGGNITVTCGSMTRNSGYGWSMSATGAAPNNKINLISVYASGNSGGNKHIGVGSALVISRTCLTP